MTSTDDKPPANKPDNQEFSRTVKLIRCEKHGISHYLGENCPECDKENSSSSQEKSS
ncbi:MAG: hypothetical protein OEV23_01360 [Gallionella sp.]|nr:hypothetical protein [Gallionella sp.]